MDNQSSDKNKLHRNMTDLEVSLTLKTILIYEVQKTSNIMLQQAVNKVWIYICIKLCSSISERFLWCSVYTVLYPPPPALADFAAAQTHHCQNHHQGEEGEGVPRGGPPGRGHPSTSHLAPEWPTQPTCIKCSMLCCNTTVNTSVTNSPTYGAITL